MNKLFFGGGKAAPKASRPETKTALSLVLFEDVMPILMCSIILTVN